jgi:hypothetical protein
MRRATLPTLVVLFGLTVLAPDVQAAGFLKKLFKGKSEATCCEPAPEPKCCEPAPEPKCCEPAQEPSCCAEPAPPACCSAYSTLSLPVYAWQAPSMPIYQHEVLAVSRQISNSASASSQNVRQVYPSHPVRLISYPALAH